MKERRSKIQGWERCGNGAFPPDVILKAASPKDLARTGNDLSHARSLPLRRAKFFFAHFAFFAVKSF